MPDIWVGAPTFELPERDEDRQEDMKGREKRSESKQEKEQRERFIQGRKRTDDKTATEKRESLVTVLSRNRRVVILGNPGAGKSTLLRYLLLIQVQGGEKLPTTLPPLADIASMVPIYMPLAAFAECWDTKPGKHPLEPGERAFKDFLPRYLREKHLDAYINFIMQQLEHRSILFLLDGLDEITDATLRGTIVQQIETFSRSYPNSCFIVTSRVVGYRDAPLAADFPPFTLADFSKDQIKLFTQRWCPAYERWVKETTDRNLLEAAATKEAEKLFQATQHNIGVKKLAINPLLLTILAIIQRQGIELPSHRIELYLRCTETLIDTWVKARGQSLTFSKNNLIKILRPLAFWMHNQKTVGEVPEDELTEQIVKQLLDRKITSNEGEATTLSDEFLATIRGKTGILVERGKQRFGFLHQTFEEYFAARELVLRKDRNDFIKEHLHEARWREVILLAVGSVGILDSNEEGATELVQDVILQADSPFEKWLHRDLIFAGTCLADDVGVSIECEEDIVEQVVYLYSTSPYDSLRQAFSSVMSAWNETRIARKASALILPVFRNPGILMGSASSRLKPEISSFTKRIRTYFDDRIQECRKAQINLVQLHIMMILNQLQMNEQGWIDFALQAMLDSDWRVRAAAATALGQVGTTRSDVVDALLTALSDPNPYSSVRAAAATALGQVGTTRSDVVDALLTALSDPNPDPFFGVQAAAATALGQVGTTRSDVVDALLTALSYLDVNVSRAIANTLTNLRIDRNVVGQHIAMQLQRYEPITSKQFAADEFVDILLFALQQIVGEA